jgi:sialidase-1
MRYLFPLVLALPAAAAEPVIEKHTLFEADAGGYATYRIPGLVVTDKGTLLAYGEARKSASDWGKIDLVYRRSTDGGRTWGEPGKVVDVGGGFEKNPVAVNQKLGHFPDIAVHNPVMIADRRVVHLLYCVEYMRCYYSRSEDDGKSFAPPVEITPTFEAFRPAYDWKVIATGPGHGIRLKSGRLVVPVWLSTGEGRGGHRPSAVATVYSDDGGRSWAAGDIVVKHPDLKNPSETAAVELPDGRVMLNIRHESEPHRRAVSVGPDGATKWSKPTLDSALPEPVCMGSLVRWGDWVLFSNPHNPAGPERKNLSVHVSEDGGKTWKYRRTIEPGPSGYSDLAVGPDGWGYCFYEGGVVDGKPGAVKVLVLAKFNRDWLLAGK